MEGSWKKEQTLPSELQLKRLSVGRLWLLGEILMCIDASYETNHKVGLHRKKWDFDLHVIWAFVLCHSSSYSSPTVPVIALSPMLVYFSDIE